jgi:hypothetical protein
MINMAVLRAMAANGATVEMILAAIEADLAPPPEKRRKAVTGDRRTPLPDGWSPPTLCVPGWPPEKVERELQRFKDYALAHGKRYSRWDAAWRNWVSSPYQSNGGNGNGPGIPPKPGSRNDLRERNGRALNQLKDFAGSGGSSRDGADGWLPFAASKRP